jgi:hypothetical protein
MSAARPLFHQEQTFVGKERPLRANTGCELLGGAAPAWSLVTKDIHAAPAH